MHNPFSRTASVTDAKYVSLTPSPNAPELSNQIRHPESLQPIAHAVNRYDPHENMDALRQLVCAKVAALHAAGALDQDNMRALFQELVGWRETWTDEAKQHAESRRKVAAALLAQLSQNVSTATAKLRDTRDHRDEVFALREQLRWSLGIPGHAEDDTESLENLLPRTSRVSRHLRLPQSASHDNTKGCER